jgi:hypothetical protein
MRNSRSISLHATCPAPQIVRAADRASIAVCLGNGDGDMPAANAPRRLDRGARTMDERSVA